MSTTQRNEPLPRLIVDLTDLVLTYAMRLHVGASHDYRRKLTDVDLTHTYLTAADSEAHRADLVRAAIVAAWWLDLNWASERGEMHLLEHMLDLDRSGKRPLQYSRHGLDRAAERGFFDVVKWWYARRAERIMWFPDVGPSALGRGLVLVSIRQQKETGSAAAEFDLDQLLEWAVSHICTNDKVSGSHFADTVESLVTCAIECGNEHILQSLVPHLEPNQERLLFTYGMDLKNRIAQLPGKCKQKWAIGWIARNMPHFDLESCHLHALYGSFASGDLEWVQWCLGEWQRHAQMYGSPSPTLSVTDLTTCAEVAGRAGHLELIEWIADQFPVLRSSGRFLVLLDEIALQGHLHVVEWWKENGVQVFPGVTFISATPNIIYKLTERGLTHLVQWWVESSGLPFEAGETPIVAAAKFGNVELLNWWNERWQSGNECEKNRATRFTLDALELASVHGQIEVLEWWKKNGKPFPFPLEYSPFRLTRRLCTGGQLASLKWWYKHILDAANPITTCMWTDKNCIRKLLKDAQGTQLDVFEWLADLYARQFGERTSWLHMRDDTTIHPLLAKYYLHHGYPLPLSEHGFQKLVATCISKGLVLVLHDLQRQLKALHLADASSSLLCVRSQFGRQMCVLDYLVRQYGVKWRTGTSLIVNHLVHDPALFALEWVEHVGPSHVELPPMADVWSLANQIPQFRNGGLLDSSHRWLQRRMNEEHGK